jgi:Porin subfamily
MRFPVRLIIAAALCAPLMARAEEALKAPPLGEPALPSLAFSPCAALGPRLMALPDSPICLRIGGGVSATLTAPQDRASSLATRIRLFVNAATVTAFGSLRSSIVLSGRGEGSDAAPLRFSQGFISLAGATLGRTRSFFDAPRVATLEAPLSSSKTVDLAAMTMRFSPATAATLSIEDATARAPRQPLGADATSDQSLPDLVGRVRYDDGRFSAQASGVLRWLEWSLPEPESRLGYAAQAQIAFRFAEPLSPQQRFAGGVADRTAPVLMLAAAFGEGASSYLGFGADVPDGGCGPAGCGLARGYSLSAGWTQPLGESWSATVAASYGALTPAPGAGTYREWRASAGLSWKPVDLLTISTEAAISGQINRPGMIRERPGFTPRLRVEARF